MSQSKSSQPRLHMTGNWIGLKLKLPDVNNYSDRGECCNSIRDQHFSSPHTKIKFIIVIIIINNYYNIL